MAIKPEMLKRWGLLLGGVLIATLGVAAFVWREDILRTALDPKQPFQTYRPPPAPNYASRAAWALLPPDPLRWTSGDPPADVFFIHPTTFDGGKDWVSRVPRRAPDRLLARIMLPNYAGPFQRVGRVFAPRYRQASLYAFLTNRDDAREARRFAYQDVKAAFQQFRARWDRGRPLVIVGVEQGGGLADRLTRELIAPDPKLLARTAAVYLMETVTPAADYGPQAALPACARRAQARCVVAWASAPVGDEDKVKRVLGRGLVWNARGQLVPLGARLPLCVNPLLGAATDALAPERLNLGAANASGLEWGLRPAFLPRQVSARCVSGLLRVSNPPSPSLRPAGSWADRLKAPSFNLFYADLEADAKARIATLMGRPDFPLSAPSIDGVVEVRSSPIHRVD